MSASCPHCADFYKTTFPDLKKDYIDTGKIRFIFREFPLDPLAAAASMLARCAGKDKFFPLIEAFFAQQKDWVVQKPLQPMFAIAKQAGFTQQSFDQCLANQQLLSNLEEQRTRATQKFNVNSTPTFFLNWQNGVDYNLATQTPQYQIQSLYDIENIPISAPTMTRPGILADVASITRSSEAANRNSR